MRLGVLTAPFHSSPLADTLDLLADAGVEAIELGTGNYPGNDHCDPDELLGDVDARRRLAALVESRGLFISALSQHGNPLHPQAPIADAAHDTWRKTVELASALEVPVVNAFSGCPGDSPGSLWPIVRGSTSTAPMHQPATVRAARSNGSRLASGLIRTRRCS